jgi:hypothetical protein
MRFDRVQLRARQTFTGSRKVGHRTSGEHSGGAMPDHARDRFYAL